jgi:predicted transcriptional regulator
VDVAQVTKPLLDVLFMSDKRKEVLLLLQDGAKEMEVLVKALDTTRQALLPQIRTLEDHYLVSHRRDTYELTSIGKLIVDEMTPLRGILKVFDNDTDYWGTHKLDFIPPHLLKKIGQLGQCRIINPPLHDAYELNRDIVKTTLKSRSLISVTSYLHPSFPTVSAKFSEMGIQVQMIITADMFKQLKLQDYDQFRQLLKLENTTYWLYPKDIGFMSFIQNDYCSLLRLITNNGLFDNKQLLFCDPAALQWGREFFEHYLKDSTLITGI